MDDLSEELVMLKKAVCTSKLLSEILSFRGFHLIKWCSNSKEFLSAIASKEAKSSDLEIHPDDCLKTLGLLWDSQSDQFIFKTD